MDEDFFNDPLDQDEDSDPLNTDKNEQQFTRQSLFEQV